MSCPEQQPEPGRTPWRLPGWTHVPGRTAGADEAPLEAAKATVPARFASGLPDDHPALLYGLRLHARGFFWEAHEVLEAVWMACPPNGRDRRAVRGAIQLANAALKLHMGRPQAALRLLREAADLLDELGPRRRGRTFADALDGRELARALAGRADVLAVGAAETAGVVSVLRSVFEPTLSGAPQEHLR